MARAAILAIVLCAIVAGSAADGYTRFLADTLAKGKAAPKARTTDYYEDYGYSQTEIACLNQLNFRSCRYTGCVNDQYGATSNDTCGPTNVFLQTDLTCCPKSHQYGYEHDHQFGSVGFSDKVGTCDWEISLYRWGYGGNDAGDEAVTPVLTDDGTALKFGTVWGTCYLNSNAEHCEEPLCERMAISIQGGLYVSRAYSTESTNTTLAVKEETCGNSPPNCGSFNCADITRKLLGLVPALNPNARLASDERINPLHRTASFVTRMADMILAPTAGSQAAAASTSEAKTADYAEKGDPLYEGLAVIVSGPFYETSKHDSGKLEETGLFEGSPAFWPTSTTSIGTEPINNWPIVRGRTGKLRFTRENKEHYGHGGQSRRR